ncbi:MAG: PhzF family phenazine biosynthesis protein [Gammaproteobacteria bacterium]|nr:MAG: PhzF family phenazine biosynthesis protein [Gammaproteobacteria bacterium]UCH38550.1 MAG: PhzF family phenazine biosynthesis protein [Gammaproteobacteria bacterium]
MQLRRFTQCDVFSPLPGRGNALAVVLDGDGLSDQTMQRFAAWTNLAETTFLLPPLDASADYRLRIFSPAREVRFAGHPTLGSCAAWLHGGGRPGQCGIVRQECAIGIVEIDIGNPEQAAFTAPPTRIRPMSKESFAAITSTLEISPERILHSAELDNGPVFQVMQLDSAEAVLALDPSRVRWPEFRSLGFIGAHPAGAECDYEVRMLAPSSGMSEDPITGSLNSALAHWLQAGGRLPRAVTVAQGTCIDRIGRVAIRPLDGGNVSIGGQTHILIEGTVLL